MDVNFTGKLFVEKNIKSLKKSSIEEIEQTTRRFVEHPQLTKLFFEDVTICNCPKARDEAVMVKFGKEISFEMHSGKDKLNPYKIVDQLFMILADAFGIPFYMNSPKGRIKYLIEILKKVQAGEIQI